MKNYLNSRLTEFLSSFDKPVYVVGGFVRNFLIDEKMISTDVDLAAPIDSDIFLHALNKFGAEDIGHYKRTHTVTFKLGGQKCEFTSFRSEVYAKGGGHTPISTERTDDIVEDAKRRDFKCNAIYYDVKNGKLVDPLGGVKDIQDKVINTVIAPEEVFAHDGLRLMRLARLSGELGFKPTKEVQSVAKKCADNILDISAERILTELNMILLADKKYPFSPKDGHYNALKILDKTRVLDRILPELTLGRGMEQRKDFHNHDVLEHSLRAVKYASPEVRLSALLHDVGKPYQMINTGKYHAHDKKGAELVKQILTRLKAPEKVKKEAEFLTSYHMLDMREDVREMKLRRFFVKNIDRLEKLFAIKIADFRACKDEEGQPQTLKKWKSLLEIMKKDGTPFSLKQLKISGQDLIGMGMKGDRVGKCLDDLFDMAVANPDKNNRGYLLTIAKKYV